MARINIEDSLFKENGWLKLVKKCSSHYEALGLLTSAFMLAQKYWVAFGHIPEENWDTDFDIILEVGLAKRTANGGFYLKGSEDQFKWLRQRSEAGQTVSEKKLKQLAEARKKRWDKPEDIAKTLNGSERNQNGSEALSLPLSLSQDTDILSVSDQTQTQQIPLNNYSATQNFNARFSPDLPKWEAVLENFGLLKRLRRNLGQIINSFEDPQAFQDFVEIKATCDACKTIMQECGQDKEKARPRIEQFVIVCIKREIGALSEKPQAV